MKSNRAVLTALVLLVVIAAGWWLFHRGSGVTVDLLSEFPQAKKQGGEFAIADASLGGDSKQAISAPPNGRLTFHVRVPDDGWLRVSLGMKPESWDKEGDGVLFRIGISDGRAFEDLMTMHVDPFHNKADRRWIPVAVDVSAYAGEEVEVIFNTNVSMPGKPDDSRNDTALFGTPEIVVR